MSRASKTALTVDDVADDLRKSLTKLRSMKSELDSRKAKRLEDLVGELESEVARLDDAGQIVVIAKVELTEEEIDQLTYEPIVERRKRRSTGRALTRDEVAEELEEEFPFLRDY